VFPLVYIRDVAVIGAEPGVAVQGVLDGIVTSSGGRPVVGDLESSLDRYAHAVRAGKSRFGQPACGPYRTGGQVRLTRGRWPLPRTERDILNEGIIGAVVRIACIDG